MTNITTALSTEVKKQCGAYCRERWHAMDYIDEDVTPSALDMFRTLTIGLNAIYKALTPRLQSNAIARVARDFDEFLLDNLVMEAYFSEIGAKRFAQDVEKNLLPLFGQYLTNPRIYFARYFSFLHLQTS